MGLCVNIVHYGHYRRSTPQSPPTKKPLHRRRWQSAEFAAATDGQRA